MPKSEGQKLKLLYLADLLRRETDEDHALSMSDILSRLEELGVHAERKSIYDDLRALEDYGMDIIATRGRAGGYQLAHREFELPELKLLVDAVQSSKFLSVKKSRELIRKLEGLASRWEAQSLQRQVYAVGRVKSMNESIYYSIDTIHTAISQDRQIAFRYFEWTMEKTVRYRRDGQLYERSPYALVWDDENYYLPTTTQRRRRASAITAWTKWRICPFWKSPGWARRHSTASTWRSTPNRCSGCSAVRSRT